LESDIFEALQKKYNAFMETVASRKEKVAMCDLGEVKQEAIATDYAILGSDKESTVLAIIMKHLDSENLDQNAGVVLNTETTSQVLK
jgi:hypothetical protein